MATEAVFLRLEHFKSSLHMRSVTQSIHPISLYRRLQTTTRHLLPLTLLLLLGLLTTTTAAASTPDARSVIHQTLQIMQHDGGAKFNYSFHLGKLFNRHGTMIYKGNKSLSWNKKSMVWANGETDLGLQQYYNPSTGKVMVTDFTKHPALIYPKPYSTKRGDIVVSETAGQQFYIGSLTDEMIRSSDFSNARFVRNFFESTCSKSIMRSQMEEQAGQIITAGDLAAAGSEGAQAYFAKRSRHVRMGFHLGE